ncbi:MAG: DinB family protein [Fimbriimonas sp.]
MSTLTPLLEAWDEAHREFAIALGDFPEGDLWKRAHPRLLSVGELSAHIAYAQAAWVFGGGSYGPDLTTLPVTSPLIDSAVRYYLGNVEHPFTLDLTAPQVLAEVTRVYERVKEAIAEKGKDDPYPGQWGTWGNLVQYQVFHVAYHTGQIYSVRHLLGHETEDN